MKDTIRLLEDRIGKAVDRIRSLNAERDDLRREIQGMKERIAALQASETTGAAGESWRAERERVVGELRATLDELEAD